MNHSIKIVIGVCVSITMVGIILFFALSDHGFLNSFQDAAPKSYQPNGNYKDVDAQEQLAARAYPELRVKDSVIELNKDYSVIDYILSAKDADGSDLMDTIKIKGEQVNAQGVIHLSTQGEAIVEVIVMDKEGLKTKKEIVFLALEKDLS